MSSCIALLIALSQPWQAAVAATASIDPGSLADPNCVKPLEFLAADGSCVPQLVDRDADPEFHALLTAFGARTGLPVLLSSSLDLRGDPPARGETEARGVLARSGLDLLVVENRLYDDGAERDRRCNEVSLRSRDAVVSASGAERSHPS